MLSIIIVNFHSEKLLADCLHSLYAQPQPHFFEVIVVDNGSEPSARTAVLSAFPQVRWIKIGYNAGFARANNQGIRLSAGEAVLLLNPDVLIEEDAVRKCYEAFVASPYVGCGVQLLNPDRTPQISGSFFMKGALNHLLPLPVLGKLFKALGQWLKVKKTSVFEAQDIQEVDWVNGAFLMVKKSAIEKAGLLDEDFFLYAEEIEWCSRLRKTGKLCIYGKLHAVHLQGEVANQSFGSEGKGYYNLFDQKGRQLMLSNFLRIRKQFGAGWLVFHLLVYLAELPFFLTAVILGLFIPSIKWRWRHFSGYLKNLLYLLGQAPRLLRNQPHFYKV